jgi:glycosyltransferase involved in cell wall biosynthesis
VVTCHDLIPLGFPDMWRTWVSRNTGLRWFKRSLQGLSQVQRIMADSWATRGSLQRYDPMVGQKTVVVPLGISPVFRPARDEAERALLRDKYNLRSDMRYVLHVGRCWRYKNIEGLLRVFAKTDQKCSTRCMLLRVGETLSEEHRRLADHLHIATQVHEMGSMSTEGLAELYRAADVLLFPSRYEGFGLPVLEAMASGLPVVASNVASLPEVAGEAALLLSPDDYDGLAGAVCRVLEDVGLREALRAKGLAQAREFSWEKCARETMAVYEEVCR